MLNRQSALIDHGAERSRSAHVDVNDTSPTEWLSQAATGCRSLRAVIGTITIEIKSKKKEGEERKKSDPPEPDLFVGQVQHLVRDHPAVESGTEYGVG